MLHEIRSLREKKKLTYNLTNINFKFSIYWSKYRLNKILSNVIVVSSHVELRTVVSLLGKPHTRPLMFVDLLYNGSDRYKGMNEISI